MYFRFSLLLLIPILGASFMNSRPISAEEKYMERFMQIAIDESLRSGIPVSIKLAQGMFESQFGKSELAINANNHFGIKCKNDWTGSTYAYKDDDIDSNGNLISSCFRSYPSPEESYRDHTAFILNRSRYKKLFEYARTDYESWAYGLKSCGYATDPDYASKLIRTIKKYNLDLLDIPEDGSRGYEFKKFELVNSPVYVTLPSVSSKSEKSASVSKINVKPMTKKKRKKSRSVIFTSPRLSESK